MIERDDLGRIVEKTETIGGVTTSYDYEYDSRGRLSKVFVDGTLNEEYRYEGTDGKNGNRTSWTIGASTTTATYDVQDRLLSAGGTTYEYTDHGDLWKKTQGGQTDVYTYDVFGNLRRVAMAIGITIDYVIDAANRRIGRKVNGAWTHRWIYQDQLNPVAELDGAGNVTKRFVYGTKPHVPDYFEEGGETYLLVSDNLGSVRQVVDASDGSVVQQIDYDAFGNPISLQPWVQPFGYAGGMYDGATGLVRFGARDYDAEVGRWTARDPIGFAGEDANLYLYVAANPIQYQDPTGLARFCKRPLAGQPWLEGYSSGNDVLDAANLEFSHEQIFFDDVPGHNLGFFKEGKAVPDQPHLLKTYKVCEPTIYDDETLRQAADDVGDLPEYSLLGGSNCQDWASQVRQRYYEIQSTRYFSLPH